MTPLRPANFRIDEHILDALRRIKERDGIPVSEQLRRALDVWIESHQEGAAAGAELFRAMSSPGRKKSKRKAPSKKK